MVHSTYDLYKLCHEYIRIFPKSEKYSLGQRLENTTLDILELMLSAARADKTERIAFLKTADTKINLLKTMIRLAGEIKILDDKKYLLLQAKLQEIGKMVGGWRRYTG